MTDNWRVFTPTDKERILAFLETDRVYAAYAIGDLEPSLFRQCSWACAEKEKQLRALGLLFRGLNPPAYFVMGDPDGVTRILKTFSPPGRIYLTCREEHLPIFTRLRAWERKPDSMWRMVLRRMPVPAEAGGGVRLTGAFAGQLKEFFRFGGGIGFSPEQIDRGVFFGIFSARRLLAVAGTHLVSPAYGVAAVGNVLTHPDFRNRGYGAQATGAVVSELLRKGIRDIVLNVRQDNLPAVHLYEKIGFERYCAFFEGAASIRVAGKKKAEPPLEQP
jgi:RimJ/RimL family protein N-acetyltransferase